MREGENATFDVVVAAPDGTPIARSGLRYELLKIETRYQYYRRDGAWKFEPVKIDQARRRRHSSMSRPTSPPASRCRCSGAAIGSKFRPLTATDRLTSVDFDAGWYAEATADTPDLLEVALDKPEYAPGDSMTVAVTARTAGGSRSTW